MYKEASKGKLMTSQAQQVSDANVNHQAGFPAASVQPWDEPAIDEAQSYRAGAYRLLAALLRHSPDSALLKNVAGMSDIDEQDVELAITMSMLGLAARSCDEDALDDEYHNLFIGLGRGELVPYGSWYMTGFLMEKPLGELRDDLAEMGFVRSEDVHEPEDHIAALCEVMSMLIDDNASGEELSAPQTLLFERHIAPWADRFFNDLSESESAIFYRSVGRFGAAFIEFEKRYLSMQV
jgi:TorA maturation chaperone TorD